MFKIDMAAIRAAADAEPPRQAANDENLPLATLAELATLAISHAPANEWLRDFLADHIVPAIAIRKAAAHAGIPWHEVQAAAEDMLVRVMTSDGKTYWAMPQRRIGPWVH